MIARVARAWRGFWFTPASPRGLVVARTLVAANALWVVLSRPDLPELVAWPREFWMAVGPWARLRFLVVGVPALEWILFALLHVALVATLFGIRPRISAFAAALLMYHFAPFEDLLVYARGPFFYGLTLPILALVIVACTPAHRWTDAPSPDYRWPLQLVRVLFAMTYFGAGYSKLTLTGLEWLTCENMQRSVRSIVTRSAAPPPWAEAVMTNPALCWATATATVPVELAFPLVLVSRTATAILLPLVAAGHLLIIPLFGIFFFNLPILLIYLDWDRLTAWVSRRVPRAVRVMAPREETR